MANATQPAALPAIRREDVMIPSDTAGIRLRLRRKRLAHVERFPAERTVLMMHGATISSVGLYDVPAAGASFMDQLAARGFDVYALDVRGYGGSTSPSEMAGLADATAPTPAPAVRIETAVRDLAAAVNHVLGSRGLTRLHLVAMSWGGSVAGAYAAGHPDQVVKLALIAPLWLTETPPRIDQGGELGPYRDVDVRRYGESWRAAAPEDQRASLVPGGWFETWAQTVLATGPKGAGPGLIRVPSGAVQDIRDYWTVGCPFYDPAEIQVPVLLVHAEWDADVTTETVRDLFRRLTGAPYRRWVEIGAGTHMVILEKNHWQVTGAVAAFLEETYLPPA